MKLRILHEKSVDGRDRYIPERRNLFGLWVGYPDFFSVKMFPTLADALAFLDERKREAETKRKARLLDRWSRVAIFDDIGRRLHYEGQKT